MTTAELSSVVFAEAEVARPAVLTVAEAAAEVRVSEWSIYQLVKSGHLRSLHVGRAVRIPRAALDQFIAGEVAA